MLVEFTVENFRSIRDKQTFSMEATKLKSPEKSRHLDESNVFQATPKMRLLTAAAIYGANSSGKSNLVKALRFMRRFVLNSSKEGQINEKINVEPFLLSEATENKASLFEVVFFVGKRRFRYGFEATKLSIKAEWLFEMGINTEKKLFTREEQAITRNSHNFPEGHRLEDKVRPNALFLSVCAQFNGEVATLILNWFASLAIASGLEDKNYGEVTLLAMRGTSMQKRIDFFLKQLDVNIEGVTAQDHKDIDDLIGQNLETHNHIWNDAVDALKLETLHTKYSESGLPVGQVQFDLNIHESDGTRKIFFLSGLLLATLILGEVLIVDELDARLHPLLTCAIIQLFGDKQSNPRGAQLIFTTHDTNLLSSSLFRRDQIWFAEKDNTQGTSFYSLAEFPQRVRYDANLEDAYIHGKFGAIPLLGNLKTTIGEIATRIEEEESVAEAA